MSLLGESKDYTDILNELIKGIDSKGEGPVVSEEEIKEIEQNENYIELDYDTVSKNYVIAYEQETDNVILRSDIGGKVVKQNLDNKKDLSKLMKEKIKRDNVNCYHMRDSREYKVTNEISSETFESNNSDFRQYENGIYGIKIQSEEKLNYMLERYNIELEEEISSDIFDKADIILMISKYNIEDIEARVGGLTYTFTGSQRENSYLVNIFAASKAINTNCVYRNLDGIINTNNSYSSNVVRNNTSKSQNNINTNSTTTATSSIDTTVRISKEQAAEIAEKEAEKEKYQYQPWKSDFSAKEFFSDENGNYEIAAELLYSLDDIHRLYYWQNDWAIKDSSGNKLYQGQPIWCIRLGDKNDPLTSLYIYVDATNGSVVGAGQSSD